MRQGWVLALVLVVAGYLSWSSWKRRVPSGTTAVDVSLPKGLVEAGVKARLRTGQRIVDLEPGHQELETKPGENDLGLLCPRALAETQLFRRAVADRKETVTLALQCKGQIGAITCQVKSGGVVTPTDLVSCER